MFRTPEYRILVAAVLWAMPVSAQITLQQPTIVPMAGPSGYVINFSGEFGKFNLRSGVFTRIAIVTPNAAGGIGGAPGGPFYTVDGVTGHLLRISAEGVVTDVGDTGTGPGVGPDGVSVIGSLTTGALYALDFSNRLFSIDSATGALKLLGTLPLPPQEPSYIGNMTTSFNGDATHLYYSIEISEGPNTTGPTLYKIDPVALRVSSTRLKKEPSRIIGSGFIADGLCAFTAFGEILHVNTVSGVTKVTGRYDSGATADNPGPPLTGIFGVIAAEPGTYILGGRAFPSSRGCKAIGRDE